MKPCSQLTNYLDRRLPADQAAAFETHLNDCLTCRAETSRWKKTEAALAEAVEQVDETEPSYRQIVQLTNRAQARRMQRPVRRRRSVYWSGAIAATLATGVITGIFVFSHLGSPSPNIPSPAKEATEGFASQESVNRPASPRQFLQAPAGQSLKVKLGPVDHIVLGPDAKIELLALDDRDVRLRHMGGEVTCAVEPRRGRGSFVVESGPYAVRVVGTRFSVTSAPDGRLGVLVSEGQVEVSQALRASWPVNQGQQLTVDIRGTVNIEEAPDEILADLDRLFDEIDLSAQPPTGQPIDLPTARINPPARRPVPGTLRITKETETKPPVVQVADRPQLNREDRIRQIQELILAEDYRQAEQALGTHLRGHPKDSRGWLLLADVQRKTGQSVAAVDTYLQVVKMSNRDHAHRAQYWAGTICQEKLRRHDCATEAFRAYLASTKGKGPHRFSARLRLARSLIAQGNLDEADRHLTIVAQNQDDQLLAQRAEKLKNQIKRRKSVESDSQNVINHR